MRRSFVDTLRDLRGGEVLDQLDEQMQELVRPHKTLEAAFRATWQRIAEETTAVILLGMPE